MAPRIRLRSIVLGAVAVSAAGLAGVGCLQDFDAFTPGSGGGSSTSTTVVSSSSGDMTSSSSGVPPECTPQDVSKCTAATNECEEPICDAMGKCGIGPKAAHEDCNTAGPQQDGPGVCDGSSVCIGCIGVEDCPLDGMGNMQLCPQSGPQANVCVPAGCTNMEKDGAETDVDCGGGGVSPCPGCVNDKICVVNTDCASGSCQAGLCKPCAAQGDCEAANYCDTTATPTAVCKLKEVQGVACTLGNDQCGTGFCTDGFCCDTACGGTCNRCDSANTAAADGTCAPTDSGKDPDTECNPVGGQGCRGDFCDGASACGFKAAGATCGDPATCVNGTTSNPQDVCAGGSDTCNGGMNQSCLPNYACTGSACNTTCTTGTQCSTGQCELTAGSPLLNDCVLCTTDAQCGAQKCEQAFNGFEDTCVECAQSSGAFPAANTHCAASTEGKGCRTATDTCGCSAASEATTCAGLPPHCATSGANNNSCVECDNDGHCSADNTGHDCSPTGAPANTCGCDADGDCTGIPNATRCLVASNLCVECANDGHCSADNTGHNCSPTGGVANTCGCDADADCTGIAGATRCALSGVNNRTCQECEADSNCSADNTGHDCSPVGGTANTCGCDDDTDCTGIAGATRCAVGGANNATCQECNSDANCSGATFDMIGHDCSPTGGMANKCGCTVANEALDCADTVAKTCNAGTHVCNTP